ncbi:MAG: PstS family phosphate ABC transporter substrate-binding protein [Mycoplasmoidaceae bacterium]
MKKIKIIISSLLVASITGVIIYLSVPDNFPTINAAGSSAVSPLMTLLATEYNDADVVVQAGGSGLGIQVAVNGKKDIGMASKNPGIKFDNWETEEQKKEFEDWKKREIKTITIAWDGLGVVYKPPSDDSNFQLNIDKATLAKIYLAFAGFDDVPFSDIGSSSKTNIIPYARDGGGKQSGTADAFLKDSGFGKKWQEGMEASDISKIDKALGDGQYGKNTFKTAESNSQAWSFFKAENKSGSMIYLSAGFIINNINEIENAGFKVATYGDKGIEIDAGLITNGYNWYRPLNIMFSLLTAKQYIKDFAEWIISYPFSDTNTDKIPGEIINSAGYIELTNDQKLTMTENGEFWVPDYILKHNGAK